MVVTSLQKSNQLQQTGFITKLVTWPNKIIVKSKSQNLKVSQSLSPQQYSQELLLVGHGVPWFKKAHMSGGHSICTALKVGCFF